MDFLLPFLETLILVLALSVDAFVASFGYGTNQIKIPLVSMLVLNFVCALALAASLTLGAAVRPIFPPAFAKGFCFSVLTLLGFVKLFDSSIKALIRKKKTVHKKIAVSALHLRFILTIYADPEAADADRSHTLSPGEAAVLAAALSLDGLAVGFGAAFAGINTLTATACCFLTGMLAVAAGCGLGNRLARRLPLDLSWLSGLMLIALAFMKR